MIIHHACCHVQFKYEVCRWVMSERVFENSDSALSPGPDSVTSHSLPACSLTVSSLSPDSVMSHSLPVVVSQSPSLSPDSVTSPSVPVSA